MHPTQYHIEHENSWGAASALIAGRTQLNSMETVGTNGSVVYAMYDVRHTPPPTIGNLHMGYSLVSTPYFTPQNFIAHEAIPFDAIRFPFVDTRQQMMLGYETPLMQHTPVPLSPYLIPHHHHQHPGQIAHTPIHVAHSGALNVSQPMIPVLWPQHCAAPPLATVAANVQAHALHESQLALSPEYFDRCLSSAHELYNRGDYNEAYSLLLSLHSANRTHLPTLLLLGCTCYSLGLYDLSLQYNHIILEIDPAFSEAYSNQGTVYRALTDREGHVEMAEKCYRHALTLRPVYWDAAINLAGLLSTQARWNDALAVYVNYEKASNEPWCDVTNLDGQSDLRIVSLLEQAQIKRNGANSADRRRDLYFSKGNLYFALNDHDNAKICFFQSLLSVQFDLKALLMTYGQADVLPKALLTPQQAGALLQSASRQQQPLHHINISSALQSLAKIFQDSGNPNFAIALYYSSLAALPTANTCNNLGILLASQRLNESIEWYKFGLMLDASHVHLLTNLGSALKDQGHIDDGIQCYQKAIQLQPNFYIALANLANVYKDIGRVEEAIDLYGKALHVKPDFVEAFCNYTNSLLFVCDWKDRDSNLEKIRQLVAKQLRDKVSGSGERSIPTVLPFHTFTYSSLSCDIVREISCRNAERVAFTVTSADWFPGFPQRPLKAAVKNSADYERLLRYPYPFPLPPEPAPKLRIGYVSSDFNNHPLAHLMQSVFGFHNRSQFEVVCYSLSASDNSTFRAKIEQEADKFIDVSQWSLAQIVEHIAVVDKIHILVNLNGYTKGGRNEIFAARPAPISMTFMGFAGTMGAFGSNLASDFYDDMPRRWIDYFVVDETVCGRKLVCGEDLHDGASDLTENRMYTERLIYMPNSFFVNDHKQGFRELEDPELDQIASNSSRHLRADSGVITEGFRYFELQWHTEMLRRLKMRRQLFPHLSEDTIIFANFNQLYKMDPVIFKTWLNILKRVPNSVLWLLRFPKAGEDNLKQQAAEWFDESVTSRIIFTDVASKHDHIHRGRVADIFLDTPECNAHTTAADVLWTGTPIVTYPKYAFKMCSRVAASIVLATGTFSGVDEIAKFSFTGEMAPDLAPHVYKDKSLLGHWMVVKSYADYENRAVMLANSMRWVWEPIYADKRDSCASIFDDRQSSGVFQPFYNKAAKEFSSTLSSQVTHVFVPQVDDSLLMTIRKRIFLGRETCPLFDTKGWVKSLEDGMIAAYSRWVREFSLIQARNAAEMQQSLGHGDSSSIQEQVQSQLSKESKCMWV